MSNSTGRKFGTILTNKTLQDLENRKKNSTKSVVFPEKSIVCKEEPQPTKKVEPKLAELELSTVQKFPPNLEPVQQSAETKEDDDRRLYYARDFLLSFKEKCTESLEGILPEVRRENFPVRRLFTARPATPANQSTRSFRPQANSSSLLSILASPGGGVVYAATSDGKYVLPERESIHFLKNLRAPTAVTLQVALNNKEAPVSPSINRTPGRYLPPHKKAFESPLAKATEEAKPLEPVVAPAEISNPLDSAATVPVAPAASEARAKLEISMPKLITLEWKPKKVKKIKPRETDEKRLASRQKQIDIGKNTVGYKEFIAKVPKELRTKNDPKTPDKYQVCSKRSWDGQVRKWRRQLHAYDPAGVVADDLEEDLAGSESEGEDIEDDLEEIQRTEESLLPDRLKVAGSVSPKLFEANGEPAIVV